MLQSAIDPRVVRLAEARDEEPIVAMLRDLHGECGIRKGDGTPLRFSEDKVRQTVRTATEDHGATGSFLGVIGTNEPEGTVYLQLRDQFYTDDKILSEVWTFVSEPYRRSNNFKTLIAWSQALSAALKAPLVMGVISQKRSAAKARLIERQMKARDAGRYFVFNHDQLEEME